MTYPTPPAKRIPYDQNGTRALISKSVGDDHTPFQMHPHAVAAMNSDVGAGLITDNSWWSFSTPADTYYSKNYVTLVFPHPMNIQGAAVAATSMFWYTDFFFNTYQLFPEFTVKVQVSTDTTNGLDGSWTDVATKLDTDTHLGTSNNFLNPSFMSTPELPPIYPDGTSSYYGAFGATNGFYSTFYNWADTQRLFGNDGPSGPGFFSISGASNVMGVRFYFPSRPTGADALPYTFQSGLFMFHLYGGIGSSASASRLRIRNASDTGDADLLYGDIHQDETVVKTFKVKNTSSTDTAQMVSVFIEPTYSIPGSDPDDMALSLDGVTWASRLNLGTLAPGGVSPAISIRVHPTTATVGLRSALVGVHAGRWS